MDTRNFTKDEIKLIREVIKASGVRGKIELEARTYDKDEWGDVETVDGPDDIEYFDLLPSDSVDEVEVFAWDKDGDRAAELLVETHDDEIMALRMGEENLIIPGETSAEYKQRVKDVRAEWREAKKRGEAYTSGGRAPMPEGEEWRMNP